MTMAAANIAYGSGRVSLPMDPRQADWTLIRPPTPVPLPDAKSAFRDACRKPIDSKPLREIIQPGDHVVVATADGTRPVPNHILVPWMLEEAQLDPEQVTILLGTGTHRPNTPAEIARMFGGDLARRLNIVNHDAYDSAQLEQLGTLGGGAPVWLNRTYLEADRRIVLGFIEPHFFAGFSGGPKGIAPALAGLDSILHLHDRARIGHPQSAYGVLDGNPVHESICAMAAFAPPDFLINVTLTPSKEITGIFAGGCIAAHRAGCEQVRRQSMVPVPRRFPLVIASNSGAPLDQNLYQGIKGLAAAARIVEPGGTVALCCECADGVPHGGSFHRVLEKAGSWAAVEDWLDAQETTQLDQWQVQVMLRAAKQARIALFSRLDEATVRSCLCEPIRELPAWTGHELERLGHGAPVAVLPEGPLTIPYVA